MIYFKNLLKNPAFQVVLLTVVVYANSLPNGFTFDDHAIVEDNPAVRSVDIADIFTSPYWPNREGAGLYRPLTTFSFAVQHALHGLAPSGYHFVNVLLHALNALLIFYLATRLTGPSPGAWGAALVFALHPVQTEAVNGIVGRAELLSAFFVLCAWLFYIRSGVGRGGRLNRFYGLALAASFLGMLSKENAACFVGLIIAYDGIWEHRARWPGGLAGFFTRGLPRYLPFLLLVGAFLFLRTQIVGSIFLPALPAESENPLPHLQGGARWFTTLAALGVYMRLMAFPLRLSPDYSFGELPVVTTAADPLFWGPLTIICIFIGVTLLFLVRRSFLSGAVGLFAFACAFAPVSNVFVTIGTILGERLLYLPMAGAALFVGALAARLADMVEARRYVYAGLALLLGLYGIRTAMRSSDWRSDVTLFLAAVHDGNESPKVYYNLGVGYRKSEQLDKAVSAFERVAERKPEDPDSWRYLGIVYAEQGRLADAVRAYENAVMRDSTQIHLWKSLATVHIQTGDWANAIAAYEHALDIHPDDGEARFALVELCRRQNRMRRALRHAQALVDRDPAHRRGVLLLIALLLETGRRDEAYRYLEDALARWPEDAEFSALVNRIQSP